MVYDRTDDVNPPSLPPENPLPPPIMLHDGITNSIAEYKTICNEDIDNSIGEYETICNEFNKDFQFWGDISNGESETDITHDFGDNDDSDDTNNDTLPNQVDINNTTINFDEYNTISSIISSAIVYHLQYYIICPLILYHLLCYIILYHLLYHCMPFWFISYHLHIVQMLSPDI